MNTLITYQYRDSANYKEFDTVIIHGQLALSNIEEWNILEASKRLGLFI